jgi:isoquinoline 1-oxidoreductase subunit beta
LSAERERGVAVVKSFGTCVAQVVELSRNADGTPRVHNVWCATYCGVAINPNIIRAQMEGGVGYGLGAVLFDEVTLGEGGNRKRGQEPGRGRPLIGVSRRRGPLAIPPS